LPVALTSFLWFQRDERKLGPHPKCPRDGGFAILALGLR
jgi:hypothetical protein